MNKEELKQPILNLIQQDFAAKAFGDATKDQVVDAIFTVLEDTISQTDFSEEQLDVAIDSAINTVKALSQLDEPTLDLYDCMMDAEQELGIEFSEEDAEFLQEQFSQCEFSEGGADSEQEAFNLVSDYLEQNLYAFMPTKIEKTAMRKDLRKLSETIGIMPEKTRWQRFKEAMTPNSFKTKKTTTKRAWDTAKEISRSPLGNLVASSMIQRTQLGALNKVQKIVDKNNQRAKQLGYSSTDIVNDLFSESEEVVAARNAEAQERADKETEAKTPINLELAPAANDSQETAAPSNTIPDLEQDKQKENSQKFISEVEKNIDLHDDASKAPHVSFADETFDSIQRMFSDTQRLNTPKFNPGYFGKDDGTIGVGVLGTGTEYRRWRENHDLKDFGPSMLKEAMTDSIKEGMLAGTYYQSLDAGLQISSGTIKRGYKGLHALIAPTLDKAQEKLEKTGNKAANWALPDGPSAVDLVGLDGKEASEIVKVLDQTNYLNKLPEQARTLFLINLSKSGVCYIDEKGTLTKRTIVDKLVNTYQKNPDEFLEILPVELENIKDLYSKSSLISKESINTDMIYNRLKDAKSVEQVRQILTDELNVVKKPMTSLNDLVASISNDFIMLMKSDKRQFKYLINRIARDVEVMARKNGEDSISAISRAFLRNLAASANELDIKRTVEKLVIANIKYLNDLLDVKTGTFSEEEINVEGGNVNMENSPVKSTGNRTGLVPSNIGHTAGWDENDQEEGDANPSTAALEDAKDKAEQNKFSIDEHFTQTSFAQGNSSEQVSAPGFGVGAYLDM